MPRAGPDAATLMALVVLATSCSGDREALVHQSLALDDSRGASRSIELIITGRAADLPAAREAATLALTRYARWFGLPAADRVHLATHPCDSSAALEQHVIGQIVALWWGPPGDAADREDTDFRRGVTDYISGFALEDVLNARGGVRGRTAERVSLFGGHITWRFPRLTLGRRVVVSQGGAAQVERTLLTIEGLIGLTAMERAMHVASRQLPSGPEELLATISAASGRDVNWLAEWMRQDYRIDFSVHEVAERAVSVRREGQRIQVEIPIAVDFADGHRLIQQWDGGDDIAAFEFDSTAPIVAAEIDPERTNVFDDRRLNNISRVNGGHSVAIAPWVARWVGWMQHALLTSTLFL